MYFSLEEKTKPFVFFVEKKRFSINRIKHIRVDSDQYWRWYSLSTTITYAETCKSNIEEFPTISLFMNQWRHFETTVLTFVRVFNVFFSNAERSRVSRKPQTSSRWVCELLVFHHLDTFYFQILIFLTDDIGHVEQPKFPPWSSRPKGSPPCFTPPKLSNWTFLTRNRVCEPPNAWGGPNNFRRRR